MKAVVGHHRDRDAVAGQAPALAQVQRRERHQLVAVDDLARGGPPRARGRRRRRRRSRRVPARDAPRSASCLDVRGAAAGVDVAPVGRVGDHASPSRRAAGRSPARRGRWRRWRSRAARRARSGRARRSACAARAGSPRARRAARGSRPIAGASVRRRPRAASFELALDRQLGLVGELVAVAGEELDPVVRDRGCARPRARRRGRSRSGRSAAAPPASAARRRAARPRRPR